MNNDILKSLEASWVLKVVVSRRRGIFPKSVRIVANDDEEETSSEHRPWNDEPSVP